ncbi:hypothetical protein [Enterocloster lavalensis]|uniref:hypothetical protein n=1 Tax=Enterocloster lavalensis TaxID=460384 RepID=UPI001D07676E|nr:hypothetical protein [Enterocloster lavalensis]MCB6344483.1 hypothetical protein [Enterocloster lavalensis]
MNGVPVLYNSNRNSKDAGLDFKITYIWDGNNPQQTGNIVHIYDNETNETVYTATQTNFYKQECTVPANTLVNGTLYKVTVNVMCAEGVSSPSEPLLFYCYTTPDFVFTNLVQDQLIQNDSYQVRLSYSQPEGEELEDYYISLYSSDKTVIHTSPVHYHTEELSLTVTGMENNTQYYIKAFGQTVTGMQVETDFFLVSVRYLQPTIYSLIELANNAKGGYTTVKSNIISLRAYVYRDGVEIDPTYVNGEMIDLRDSSQVLRFEDSFGVPDDFTIELKGCSFAPNSAPMVLSNGKYAISVYYRTGAYEGTGGVPKAYFDVRAAGELTYVGISNYIELPADNRLIGFMLTRRNNLYEIVAFDYGEEVEPL